MQFATIPVSGYGESRGRGWFGDTRSPVFGGRHLAQRDGLMDASHFYLKSSSIDKDGLMDVPQILFPSGPTHNDSDRLERSVAASSTTSSSSSGQPVSNLSRFLDTTTPRVTIRLRSKGCSNSSKYYFNLSDLWDGFDEWSAYGVGVPIVLYGKETVMQYYVPYLSAVQLYTSEKSGLLVENSDESNGGCETDNRDGASGISSDRKAGKLSSEDCSLANGNRKVASLDFSDQPSKQGANETLIFEYVEAIAPSLRVPLYDKVNELAHLFPDIRSFCSNDLSRSSWLSVAWYPIYRIPTGPTLKDLGACFLTYHHLSTLQADRSQEIPIRNALFNGQLALCPFGLSSYKFWDAVWISAGSVDCHLASSLQRSSEGWLKQLHVHHPDFEYFISHRVPVWH